MAIFLMRLKGCDGLIEVGGQTIDQIMNSLGDSQQFVESLELTSDPDTQGVTDYFEYVTDLPFAHLPFHEKELEGFIHQLYHARHLCFLADNETEAKQWKQEYTDRGALEVSYAKAFPGEPGAAGEMYNVVIKVFPPEAESQVGYTPEPDEWLGVDPEYDPCHADNSYTNAGIAAKRVQAKRKAMGL